MTLATVKRVARRRASVVEKADRDFRAAIHAAHTEGHSLRAIADAAGISHVRVLKILRGE